MNSPRLLRLAAVCEGTQLSRSQLYRLLRAGDFPRLIALLPRRNRGITDAALGRLPRSATGYEEPRQSSPGSIP